MTHYLPKANADSPVAACASRKQSHRLTPPMRCFAAAPVGSRPPHPSGAAPISPPDMSGRDPRPCNSGHATPAYRHGGRTPKLLRLRGVQTLRIRTPDAPNRGPAGRRKGPVCPPIPTGSA